MNSEKVILKCYFAFLNYFKSFGLQNAYLVSRNDCMGMSSLDFEEKTRENLISNCSHRTQLQRRSFHVVERTKKLKTANANFAKLFSFSFLMITALLSTQPHSFFLNVSPCHFFTDRDECTEIPGICANGRCENTEGSFACICQEGYKLNNERSFCISEEFMSFFANTCIFLTLLCHFSVKETSFNVVLF